MSFLLDSDVQEIAETLGHEADAFAGKRIFMTGGRGFLGRYFTEVFLRLNLGCLRRNPCELIVLDNFITAGHQGRDIPKSRDLAFIEHDIIKPFYPERPVDYILHLAGIASPHYYRKFPLETLQVSTVGLTNVLDLARNHPGSKLIYFSSSEIYGDPDPAQVPTKESYRGYVSCLGPRACYDESKRLGETLTRVYHEQHGVHGTIVRPFNIYGPGMQKTDYRVLPNFGARISEGKSLQIHGHGKQTRTFCYVTDAIRGFLQVLLSGSPGEPYNIGNPEPEVSMVDLARVVARMAGGGVKHELIEYPDTYPADEPNRRAPDIRKARLQLDYEPTVELDDGLKRFLDWSDGVYTGKQ